MTSVKSRGNGLIVFYSSYSIDKIENAQFLFPVATYAALIPYMAVTIVDMLDVSPLQLWYLCQFLTFCKLLHFVLGNGWRAGKNIALLCSLRQPSVPAFWYCILHGVGFILDINSYLP
jgi:hypothetical protein